MKSLSITALSIAMAVATAATAATAAIATLATPAWGADAAKEVAAIQAVDDVFVKAYNAGDVDTVVAQYADRAILQPPGAPPADGKAAIRAYFASDIPAAAQQGAKFVLDPNPQGGVSGDLGWSSGTFVVKNKTGQVVEKGKYLSVSRKIGGKWLYIRDMWNADDAPAATVPAAPAKK